MNTEYRELKSEGQTLPFTKTAGRLAAFLTWSLLRAPLAVGCVLGAVLCLASGCGNAEQAQAYARAEQAEQRYSLEAAPAIIADYRRVIALDPQSDWARKAGARIQAVEARVRAEETRKDVFQEHGVD